MIKLLLFLAFIVISSACVTSQISQKEAFAAQGYDYIDCSRCDDGNECTTDYCTNDDDKVRCSHENIACAQSAKMCGDGYVATCSNSCDSGVCTACDPSCEGRECKETIKQCSDGTTAKCNEQKINGTCVACEPKCACTPQYSCSEWGDCINGFHTRICVDSNRCTEDKKETVDCSAIEKKEEAVDQIPQTQPPPSQNNIYFTEIMYDPAGEETKEEYIILTGSGDVSGWTISDNSGTWAFPDGAIINGKLIIARNTDIFLSVYGCPANIGSFTRGLNNDGDQLTLKDKDGNQKDFVAWEKGASNAYPEWAVTATEGKSLHKNGQWSEASPSPC